MIRNYLEKIKGEIAEVCKSVNRDPEEIVLVGISKYAQVDQMNEAIQAGLIHIGENKVQDAKEKFPLLDQDAKIVRHMVGHLQSNKVKTAIIHFDLIESVDSIKLANEIEKQAKKANKVVDILAQINIAKEAQKSGLLIEEVDEFLNTISSLKNIKLKGLMTIAPLIDDKEVVRQCFSGVKEIFEQIKINYKSSDNIDMKYLSMGMSGDFDIAIQEGANMVRIGRALFNG